MHVSRPRSARVSISTAIIAAVVGGVCAAEVCRAGVSFVVMDRTSKKVFRVSDDDNSNTIEPSEVHVWWDATNAAGTAAPNTAFAFAVRPLDNAVLIGDANSASRSLTLIKDVDRNGSALGINESRVVLTGANASGASITAPSGVGFFPSGFDVAYVNAGAGANPDAIYRLHDGDNDGTYNGGGEAAQWVTTFGAFGSGNTVFSPQEIVFDSAGWGYLRNSNSGGPGYSIWKFKDLNGNGRADDAGEFVSWFDSTNASGIALSPGFVTEIDLARPHSLYTNVLIGSVATGTKEIVRFTDLDSNGDANGTGEAVIVFATTDSDVNIQDIVSLPDGDVYFTDVASAPGGKRIFRLHDLDGDGLFISPGERTVFLASADAVAGGMADVRFFGWLRPIPNCAADFNGSGALSVQDIFDFLNAWFNGDPRADFNNVNGLSVQDIFDFLSAWFAGCP